MKFFSPLLFILTSVIVACDPATHQEENSPADTVATNILDKGIDSVAFELLISTIEDPDRKEWQNPELVINELGNLEGKVVVDIGAGTGYFTFLIAPLAEKVIAVDIDKRFLDVIDSRKSDFEPEVSEKIETRLTLEDDPLLTTNEADVVLIVNTFHFLSNRVEYLSKLKGGMNPGSTILIVDFKNEEMEVTPPGGLSVPAERTTDELKRAGFQNIVVDQMSLKYQYIIKANS